MQRTRNGNTDTVTFTLAAPTTRAHNARSAVVIAGDAAVNGRLQTGTIVGDATKPGIYVTRITWAPGTGSRPHFHNEARYITVLKGTWYVATGPDADVYNPDKMTPVKEGTFIYEPPNGHHYDMAKDEEAVVEIIGMGPVTTTQLEPSRGSAPQD